jgi:tellurite resistance protein TerC
VVTLLLVTILGLYLLHGSVLAVVLIFIGVKMCLIDVYKIPVVVSLGVVIGILAVTMLLSLRSSAKKVSA